MQLLMHKAAKPEKHPSRTHVPDVGRSQPHVGVTHWRSSGDSERSPPRPAPAIPATAPLLVRSTALLLTGTWRRLLPPLLLLMRRVRWRLAAIASSAAECAVTPLLWARTGLCRPQTIHNNRFGKL
jgi:hypothetical protein